MHRGGRKRFYSKKKNKKKIKALIASVVLMGGKEDFELLERSSTSLEGRDLVFNGGLRGNGGG